MKRTALVVDDEPLARRKLASLVAEVPWLEQVGEADDGAAALEAIARLHPDIVFLDIRMPGLSGLQVVEALADADPAPAVVFTTAFDQYAVTAFELDAVDYLLKPFGRERFLKAVERARGVVSQRQGAAALSRARHALSASGLEALGDRIFVREGNAVVPVVVAEIERIEGQDDYAMLHACGRRHLVSLRLHALETRLPNPPFVRVHRSHLVNLDHVRRLVATGDGRLEVSMRNGATVPVSRARAKVIRRLAS